MPLRPELKAVGFIYALVMIFVLGYLWYSGRWKRPIGWLLLLVSAVLGFLIFAPVAPYQFQALVLRDVQGLGGPLVAGAAGLTVVAVLTVVFGRFFCGYLCPAGAVQEIAYHAPVPKLHPSLKNPFMAVRGIIFVIFIIMAFVFSASLLAWFGIRDFFHLVLSAGSIVFIIVLAVSMAFYRPFCRLVCPYGALLALGAAAGILKLRRTAACIACGKCEKACPTDEAKKDDAKAECYLCGRCLEVCPKEGALRYAKDMPQPPQKEH